MSIMKITKTGIRRRKSELRAVSFVTLIAVLFMSGVTLFQEIADAYVMEFNYHNYGDWIISSVEEQLSHPYFGGEGYARTGPELIGEEGNGTNIYVGCVDDNLALFGRINLYEGRLPKGEQEVAMDLYSLARLGYSYELGQRIVIEFYDEAGEKQTGEYELVGTLMSFAENWRTLGRYYLPNILVSEGTLDAYGCEGYTTYFYQFDKSYAKVDAATFAGSFIKPFSERIFNSYVYENQVWGIAEIYDMATLILMLISALAISYLLTIYIGKRRGAYYQLRTMGASKLQIRQMICAEALYATLPQTVLGLLLPYVVGGLLCTLLTAKKGMQNFFRVDMLLIGKQLVMVGLVLVFAIFIAQMSTSDKRLAANMGEIRPIWYGLLRKRANSCRRPEKALLSRYEITRPIQRAMSLLLTLLVAAAGVVCLNNITEAYSVYQWSTEKVPDFELMKETEYTYPTIDGYVRGRMGYLFNGMDEGLREQLSLVPGVESIGYSYVDHALYLDWEGKENSPMVRNMRMANAGGAEKTIGAATGVYVSFEEIGALPEEKKGQADVEKWQAGEQIIVLMQTKYYDWETIRDSFSINALTEVEKLIIYDETISPGDTVTIKNLETDLAYPVEVGAVYYITDFLNNTQSYNIIMSKALGEKLAEAQGLELNPTKALLEFNSQASFEASEKLLAKMAEENDMYYSSHMEGKRIQYQNMLQKVGVYGCIMGLLLAVYVILQKSFLSSSMRYRKENYRILKQIGMETGQYRRLSIMQAIKTYLWLYAGMAAGYGMVYYLQLKQQERLLIQGDIQIASQLLKDYTNSPEILSLEYVLFDMKHVIVILFVTLWFLFMVWSSSRTVKRYVEEN